MKADAYVSYQQARALHEAAEASALSAVRAVFGDNANLFTAGADDVAGDLIAAKRAACLLHAAAGDNLRNA